MNQAFPARGPANRNRPAKVDWEYIFAGSFLLMVAVPLGGGLLYATAVIADELRDGEHKYLRRAVAGNKADIIHDIKRAHPGTELSQLTTTTMMTRQCEVERNTPESRYRLGDNRVSKDARLWNCQLYATANGHKVETGYFVAIGRDGGWLGRFFGPSYKIERAWVLKGTTRVQPTHTGSWN